MPTDKDQWFTDSNRLRLLVKPSGAKYWRMNYRFRGRQKTLALGVYPQVTLKAARVARDKASIKLSEGIDPAEERRALKEKQRLENGGRFSVLALEWWNHQRGMWTEDHANRVLKRLEDNAFKILDRYPLTEIEPRDILKVIRAIEKRDALDVAKRVLQAIRAIFQYGVQTGQLKYNPGAELKGVVKTRRVEHRASLPNNQLGQFLRDLEQYENKGKLITKLALELLVLTFVRPGELRSAEWDDFDLHESIWRIPAAKMKMRSEHLVPLSNQAKSVLAQLARITGQYDYLFPSESNPEKPISDNTMRMAMIRMGYDGKTRGKAKATPHGFRANASSILNEKGFHADAIERQLSHIERNDVRAAYTHHAQYLDQRREIMQWWADYLDICKKEV